MRAGEVDKDRMLQVAGHWKNNGYYGRAERQDWLDPFWSAASPFRAMFMQLDGSCMVELACGHGRHAAYITSCNELPKPSRMILMDVNGENVDHCRHRFSAHPEIQALQNNGVDFEPLEDGSISSIFCFDAMVHFEYDCVLSYLRDAFRVLKAGGRALFHHSNYTSPGSTWLNNPHWRNFMSRDLFAHVALRTGFRVLDQVVLDWGEGEARVVAVDCLSMIEKPAGVEPSQVSLLRRISDTAGGHPGADTTIEERAAPTRESARASPQSVSPTASRAKSRHRVALVLNDMNAARGIQNAAANLARALGGRFDVILLTIYPPSDGVAGRLQQTLRTLNLQPGGGRLYPRMRRLLQMLLVAVRLRRILAAEAIDTVICFQQEIAVVAALALPVDVRKISYEHAPFAAISRGWARLRRRSYPRLDAAVTLDQENRTSFAAITRRTLVIPHEVGVRPSTAFEDRERMLLFVGDIGHRNGLDRLLWAIKEPLQAHPEWKLVLVGLGEVEHSEHWYINYLHDLMGLLHLSANVELYAAVHPPEHFYRRASMFVTGCRWELLPTMVLEAKAYGLPVVSYDHPVGLRDVVRDGVDGLIVNEGSTSLGDAVTRLIEDAMLRRQMGEAALDDVRDRFGAAQVCAQWSDLIETVHAGRAA